jgi:sterol desaturase/sphingolipid hydroxylase (fatty acid hydroxylase superfamily)
VHDPIALAIPIFFVLIGLELVWARKRGVRVYRLADALTDLSCGITSQIVLLAWAALHLAIYELVWDRCRLVRWERAWVPWVIAFFAVDFAYYWWHRLSHEVNFLWAAHVVHHQSEDYNLAVALRQAVLTSWTTLPFYLPLSLLDVPTPVFATVHAFSTLYQFWIHTELVGKVRGPVDWILNLPSHHRVHHAINPRYLDKNYAATLIVWDRLFGTYAEEIEKPVFGITKPLASFDPMWAQVHYWLEMGAMSRAAKRPIDKLRVWFASPAWKPEGWVVTTPSPPIERRAKYDRSVSTRLAAWLVANYALVVGATFCVLMWHHTIARVPLVLASVAILAALVAYAALLEGRRWARHAEALRLVAAAAAVVALLRA